MSFDLPPEPDEELPDWLKDLRGESPQPEPEFDPESGSGDELPGWLEEELPGEEPQEEEEKEQEKAEEDEEEIPEWLAGIRASEEQRRTEDDPSRQGGDEKWLDAVRHRREEEHDSTASLPPPDDARESFLRQVARPPSEEEGGEIGPDWLSGIMQEQPEENPEWLAGILDDDVPPPQDVAPETEQPPQVEEPPEEELETPDWRSETPDEVELLPSEVIPPFETPAASEESEISWPFTTSPSEVSETTGEPAPSEEEVPEWLADLRQKMGDGLPPKDDSVPAWAGGEEEVAESTPEPEPFELPDWIAEGAQDEEAAEEEEKDELAPAELPSWLQAMRPVESAAPERPVPPPEPTVQESVGPLAGLSGVLPAEPEVARYGAPPEFSSKLVVTEAQRAHASLFEQLLAEEGKAVAAPGRPAWLPQRILRAVIAVLLLLTTLVPVLTGSQSIALPRLESIPPETRNLRTLIDALPPDSTVLLAFDYQPALSGEMDAAAAAVVDHLLLQGAHLALLSTQPTGPGLGARFLDLTQSRHGLVEGDHYRNLGYLSGGATSLLGFAIDPRLVLPLRHPIDGVAQSVWDLPPLQGVQTIEDFAMILVITDDPETARAWVEQIGSGLQTTPLGMVVSAQAAPLVRPFYQTQPRLVDGLVSGITGGAYYEAASGRPSLARIHWNAFSYALSMAIIVMMLGSIYNLALTFIPSSSGKPTEETA